MDNKETTTQPVAFAAIDIELDKLVVSPKETHTSGTWVRWGDRNQYPHFIAQLAKESSTLSACILGLTDYVCGDDVLSNSVALAPAIIRETAESIATFGGFAWLVTRTKDGGIAPIEVLRIPYLRADEELEQFWYNEKWEKGATGEYTIYPRWINQPEQKQGVVYVKMQGHDTYPEPYYRAAVKAALTEIGVNDYHLGNISRGFLGGYVFNFNSGVIPTDEEKRGIELELKRKVFGANNAGRVLLSFNRNKDAMTTIQKLDSPDFSDKYLALEKHVSQRLFTAFRANPNLFGCASEGSTGFNAEEYEQSFKLFNRTMVLPIQRRIIDAWEKIYGVGDITIKPFTLDATASANIVQ